MTQQNNQPTKEFRAGASNASISASVWRNEEPQQDGNVRVRHSVKIQKRYRDKDGTWKDSDYFFPEDLPKVELVIRKCYEFISLKESKDVEESVPV